MNEGQPGRLAAALIPAAQADTVLLAAGCGGGAPAAAPPSSPQFQAALQKCNGG